MGILSTIERRATVEDPMVPLTSAAVFDILGGTPTHSGVRVTEQKALTFGAVWACVDLISGILSSLPCDLLERLEPRGRRKMVDDPRYRVARWKANTEIGSNVLIGVMQAHKLTWGNAYAEKEFNRAGDLIGLWPLLPDRTYPRRINGERWYFTRVREQGQEVEKPLPAWKVLHIPGLGFDGLRGYSVIGMAMRQAVSIGMAADEFAARFYGGGMQVGGVLSHPKTLSTDATTRLRGEFEASNGGLSRAHRLMVLEEGLKYERIGIPPEDAQFLGSRLYQRREVAGMYHVPPDMIGDLEHGGAYNSTEARAIAFRQQCLRTHAVDWERALASQLLDDDELPRRYFAFNFNELERGELKSRMEAYQIGRNMGVWSADDIREFEDENPLPDGQGSIYLVPLNMIPASQVGNDTAAPAEGDAKAARDARLDLVLGRLRRTHQALIEGALGRVARREVKALRASVDRSAGDLSLFLAGVEGYFAGFDEAAGRDLRGPIEALARYLREEMASLYGESRVEAGTAADAVTAEVVSRYRARALDQLAVDLADGITPGGAVDKIEDERAAIVANIETPRICADLAARFREEI